MHSAWVVGPVEWTPPLIRRAVIWLSLTVGKAPLKLSDDDFREHEMYELLREHGPAQELGRRVFHDMMDTISTHPAGPGPVDGGRWTVDGKEGSSPSTVHRPPSTILVFSPHPDDDVISMGGTIIRLVGQGHKVHVAYMTSGNI